MERLETVNSLEQGWLSTAANAAGLTSSPLNSDVSRQQNWWQRAAAPSRQLQDIVAAAIAATESQLTSFAASENFMETMAVPFGRAALAVAGDRWQQQWLNQDGAVLPTIEILSGAELPGVAGAFSPETQTIYLSQAYLEQHSTDPQAISAVLLEELGHFLDTVINQSDAPGDEGAIFSALVRGINLDASALELLQTEDDHTSMTLAGRPLLVEQATVNGLRGEYYDTEELTNLKLTRTDSTVNFNWGTGSPAAAIAPNSFSVRWTGQVQATNSGTYTFFVQADDGVRLWVNGTQLINDWEDYGVVRERRGTINLTAGQRYDIRLEYFEWSGQARAKLLWSAPGVTKQIIPQSQLFSPSLTDSTPPTASLAAGDVTTGGNSTYQFSVTYSDNTAMNVATLNSSDILVTGPNGFSQLAALVSVNNNTNGTPRTATYQINTPGGSWDNADNGTYTLALQPNQVSDTSGNFIPAASLGSFLVSINPLSTGENIIFPADAGVINVKDFGARGDGVTDDTAAIQAALNAYPNGNRIVYLPNGTYLVSQTLTWPAGTSGNEYKRTTMQGQSQNGVVIKLANGTAGFTNTSNPQAVIFTGPAPAQRFGNSIRNLTVDTGTGNAGAIGIQFNASNQGSLRQVTIRSGDGLGLAGLDMDFADEIGPLLVKDLTVDGFQYGIQTGYTVNSQTFENITLRNQRVYGFWNYSQVVSIRNLTSNNSVPAIYNGLESGKSHMTLINASLTTSGGTVNQPAIRNGGTLLARGITTTGYSSAIQSGSTTVVGPLVSEFVSHPITRLSSTATATLNLPIKETPDVPWDNLADWANVVTYGAIPNDGKDDTAAIQAAIDSGRTTVYLPVGNYNLAGTVFIRNNVRRLLGTEAYVEVPDTVSPGFKLVAGTHPVVVFERIHSGYEPTPTIENASSRTLVIRDATNVSGNMTGTGDVFIENVVSNPFSSWTFNRQNVWARQFNVENTGTHIINNGGNLWILGLKTERGGTLIDTRNGGKTEVLGGLAYTTTAAPNGTQNDPMFISNESSISISMAEVKYNSSVPNYTTYIREIRGGVTRNLSGSSLPSYWGTGKNIPLFVGY